jgi:hypothetical protein
LDTCRASKATYIQYSAFFYFLLLTLNICFWNDSLMP